MIAAFIIILTAFAMAFIAMLLLLFDRQKIKEELSNSESSRRDRGFIIDALTIEKTQLINIIDLQRLKIEEYESKLKRINNPPQNEEDNSRWDDIIIE